MHGHHAVVHPTALLGSRHLEGWVQEGHCALGGMQRCCGCSAASSHRELLCLCWGFPDLHLAPLLAGLCCAGPHPAPFEHLSILGLDRPALEIITERERQGRLSRQAVCPVGTLSRAAA